MQTRRLLQLPDCFTLLRAGAPARAGFSRSLFNPRRSIGTTALVAGGLLLSACVAEDVDPAGTGGTGGGASGSGGSGTPGGGGSSGSMQGSGGSSGAGNPITSNPEFGMKVPCPSPTQALILDFSPPAPPAGDAGTDGGAVAAADAGTVPATMDVSFGDFYMTFSGGTYRYPADGAWPLALDFSQNNWHLSGDVGTYSGFGLYFGGTFAPSTIACNVVDLSAYDGLSFSIGGSVAMGGTIQMSVATSANNVSHVWLNTVPMPPPNPPAEINSGRCIPPGTNQFDGSCAAASYTVTVPAEPATITVHWSDFTMGRPDATVDPTEITGVAWALPAPPGAGGETPTTYPIDLVIDDIQFISDP